MDDFGLQEITINELLEYFKTIPYIEDNDGNLFYPNDNYIKKEQS